MCDIITLPANEHRTTYGLDMGIDDYAFIVGFYIFHCNETSNRGGSWCALTIKLSAMHINFMRYSFCSLITSVLH